MPTYLLLSILAGWLDRQQRAVIEYLRAENHGRVDKVNVPLHELTENLTRVILDKPTKKFRVRLHDAYY